MAKSLETAQMWMDKILWMSIQWNSTHQLKQWTIDTTTTWMNLKIIMLKEARLKRLHTIVFHSHNVLENAS